MGAPVGNQNAAKAKRWTAAIERALVHWPELPPDTEGCPLIKGLNTAAHAFVGEMMGRKDVAFFKELGDRLDGKAPQAITGADGGDLRVLFTSADSGVL